MGRHLAWLAVAALLVAGSGSFARAQPQPGRTEIGVFCVEGRLVLAQKRIEEMKQYYRGAVCRLDQDHSDTAAREKLLRMGGANAPCSCDF
ncbi:MAG TPA: hypothetical protein PLQ97_03435 [Myxococcota bacterium]|nr:hypothetical protein [Myxococcota bacterium]HQK50092.1 hypothetical protein [Myxococcota bacterium]